MILHFDTGDDMRKFFFDDTSSNVKIYDSIVKAISVGMRSNMDAVKIWEIIFANDDEDMIVDCNRPEWKENLESALGWYTENEMFEKCTLVKNLLDKLTK